MGPLVMMKYLQEYYVLFLDISMNQLLICVTYLS